MKNGAGRQYAVHLAALLALFALHSTAPASASTITFDFEKYAIGPYGDFPAYPSGALVSDGFVLDPGLVDWSPGATSWIGHYHITDGIAEATFVDGHNGTKYFGFDYFFDNSQLNIYSVAGAEFGIRQFDLTEGLVGSGSTSVCTAVLTTGCEVTFIGQLADGGTISRVVMLDGIHDGVGALADFETFTFDEQWDRLTGFSIVAADSFLNPGLDNLVLRAVEPSSLALLSLGFAGLAFTRRRRL